MKKLLMLMLMLALAACGDSDDSSGGPDSGPGDTSQSDNPDPGTVDQDPPLGPDGVKMEGKACENEAACQGGQIALHCVALKESDKGICTKACDADAGVCGAKQMCHGAQKKGKPTGEKGKICLDVDGPKVGDLCEQDKDCKSESMAMHCFAAPDNSAKGQCVQACDADSNVCQDKMVCNEQLLYGSSLGELGKGCEPKVLPRLGDACTEQSDCENPDLAMHCLAENAGEPTTCQQACDSDPSVCGIQSTCKEATLEGQTVKYCGAAAQGPAAAWGESCDPSSADPCLSFGADVVCSENSASENVCRKACASNDDCGDKATCEAHTINGNSVKSCDPSPYSPVCSLYDEFKDLDKWKLYDEPFVPTDLVESENSGVHTLKFTSGKFSKDPASHGFAYLDFTTGEFLNISDKLAITQNVQWDLAIRGPNMFTNGGQYPGDIKIGRLKDKLKTDPSLFGSIKRTDPDVVSLSYVEEAPVSAQCKENNTGSIFFPAVYNVFTQLNRDSLKEGLLGQYFWFDVNLNGHQPKAKPDVYILKSDREGWMVKLWVEHSNKVQTNDKDPKNKDVVFTLHYAFI